MRREPSAGETARRLHDRIVEGNLASYDNLLEDLALSRATDDYWSELIPFYRI